MAANYDDVRRGLLAIGYWQDEKGIWHDPPANDGVAVAGHIRPQPDTVRRARQYVGKMPPAISGNCGHDTTFDVAQILVRGFALSADDSWPILCEYNQRCDPPWSERELQHKLDSANEKSRLPSGYILNRNGYETKFERAQATYRRQREDCDVNLIQDMSVGNFPVAVFPQLLQEFIWELSASKNAPEDFAGTTLLAVAGAAIGTSRALKLKNDWYECPRLYIAHVGQPSTGKTPVVNSILQPVKSLQAEKRAEWKLAKKDFEERMAQWNRHKGDDLAKPVRPIFQHLYTTDCTTESLGTMLEDNPRGFLLARDEIASWISSMNQYRGGKGSDRQFWLSAWSGQAIKIDRKGQRDDGPVMCNNPLINLVGGIQPDMLGCLVDERNREDGFVHRILFSYPDEIPRGPWTDREVSDELAMEWNQTLKSLYSLNMQATNSGGYRPYYVFLTPDALGFWKWWHNTHVAELEDKNFPQGLVSVYMKMISHAARFALVIHQLRLATGENESENVDRESVQRGCVVAEYFKSHMRKVYWRIYSTDAENQMWRVIDWLKGRPDNTCSTRDVLRQGFVRNKEKAASILRMLQDGGFGSTWEVGHKNNSKTTHFKLYGEGGA